MAGMRLSVASALVILAKPTEMLWQFLTRPKRGISPVILLRNFMAEYSYEFRCELSDLEWFCDLFVNIARRENFSVNFV